MGTTIELSNLFARYPVRRKILLKESQKTIKGIEQLLLAYSLIYPSYRFEMTVKSNKLNGNKKIFAGSKEIEKLSGYYGIESTRNLVYGVHIDENEYGTTGRPIGADRSDDDPWLWKYVLPKSSSSNKTKLLNLLIINKRPMNPKNPMVSKIVSHVNSIIPSSRIWVISIQIPTEYYDINIEPSKDDIQFTDFPFVLARIESFLQKVLKLNLPKAPAFDITMKSSDKDSSTSLTQLISKTKKNSIDRISEISGLLTPENSFEIETDEETIESTPKNSYRPKASLDATADVTVFAKGQSLSHVVQSSQSSSGHEFFLSNTSKPSRQNSSSQRKTVINNKRPSSGFLKPYHSVPRSTQSPINSIRSYQYQKKNVSSKPPTQEKTIPSFPASVQRISQNNEKVGNKILNGNTSILSYFSSKARTNVSPVNIAPTPLAPTSIHSTASKGSGNVVGNSKEEILINSDSASSAIMELQRCIDKENAASASSCIPISSKGKRILETESVVSTNQKRPRKEVSETRNINVELPVTQASLFPPHITTMVVQSSLKGKSKKGMKKCLNRSDFQDRYDRLPLVDYVHKYLVLKVGSFKAIRDIRHASSEQWAKIEFV